MSTNNGSASTATPVSPPNTTQYINLSNYMYYAYNPKTPFSTTLASEIGFTPLLQDGSPDVSIDNSNGLYAEAFISNADNQIVIAYEGTQIKHALGQDFGSFTKAELQDDYELFKGQLPTSLTEGAAFANSVISTAKGLGISEQNIYVTGHSLGAAEADYAASQTGLSGVTFAAPGINTAYTSQYPSNVVQNPGNVLNYVDAGDPVGSYANDGKTLDGKPLDTLASVVDSNSPNIMHYGDVDVLPNAKGEASLAHYDSLYAKAVAASSTTAEKGILAAAVLTDGKNHLLNTYATALGIVTSSGKPLLYLPDGSTSGGGFFSSASTSTSQGSVDTSYIAAAMTGGGVAQSSSATSSTGNASVLAASSDTSAQSMGVKAHAG